MNSDIIVKKKYRKIIWTLDNSPKFLIIEFNNKKLSASYNLIISWNRTVKGIDIINIKISYSNLFFQEKKASVDRFKHESNDLVKEVFNKLNQTVLMQGLTIDKFDNLYSKINHYNLYIIKYINKKMLKK